MGINNGFSLQWIFVNKVLRSILSASEHPPAPESVKDIKQFAKRCSSIQLALASLQRRGWLRHCPVLTSDTWEPQRLSAYLAKASRALCGGLMQLCLADRSFWGTLAPGSSATIYRQKRIIHTARRRGQAVKMMLDMQLRNQRKPDIGSLRHVQRGGHIWQDRPASWTDPKKSN